MKLTRTFLILALSFGISGVANAERLTWSTFFFPKIEKYNDCVSVFEKQNLSGYDLCTDKYAKKIDRNLIEVEKEVMDNNGEITMVVKNKSKNYIIKKYEVHGQFWCENKNTCKRQNFRAIDYPSISPGESIIFWLNADIKPIKNTQKKSWNIGFSEFSGFKFDY
jgi:hypothetical protein